MTEQKTFRLAVIGGDGIGPEVTAEALKVLDAVAAGSGVTVRAHRVRPRRAALARDRRDAARLRARPRSAATTRSCSARSATRRVPSGVLERGLLLRLRFALDHYVNLRPSRVYPAVGSPLAAPGEVDFVVVREGTEGPYVGNGGALRVGTPAEIATEVSVNTAYGVERVVRDAFARAQARPRRKLTLVHKNNVLVHAGHLWSRTVEAVAADFPDVTRRLPARRRGDDLPGHRPGPVRRDRHRQPVRRHPHRPGRARSPAASAWRRAATSTRTGPRRACSSRCTAPRPTSPASRRPTRPRRSCPSRCCCEHLGLEAAAAAIEAAVADATSPSGPARRDRPPDR